MEVFAVSGIGEVEPGAHLSSLICGAVELRANDIVVVTSKIVSKAESRVVLCDRDNRAEREKLIRSESKRILRQRDTLFITETHSGFICANAGIDWSNVAPGHAVLLPLDPDRSAHHIRNGIRGLGGPEVAVVITDTFGRTWRDGVTDVAIGCAGVLPIDDKSGTYDPYGNALQTTKSCTVDQIAGAAALVMGKTAQTPVAIVRGIDVAGNGSIAKDVLRAPALDLFR